MTGEPGRDREPDADDGRRATIHHARTGAPPPAGGAAAAAAAGTRPRAAPAARSATLPVAGVEHVAEHGRVEHLASSGSAGRVHAFERDAEHGGDRDADPARPTRSAAARRSSRPRGHTAARNTTPPMSRASAAKSTARSIPYTTPTVVLPPVRRQERVGDASAFFLLSVALAPTWNVNAPSTGCESAEMTRQVTTYVPSSSFGNDDRDLALRAPFGCSGDPVTTRSRSRREHADAAERDLDRFVEAQRHLARRLVVHATVLRVGGEQGRRAPTRARRATTTSATTSAPSARRRRIMRCSCTGRGCGPAQQPHHGEARRSRGRVAPRRTPRCSPPRRRAATSRRGTPRARRRRAAAPGCATASTPRRGSRRRARRRTSRGGGRCAPGARRRSRRSAAGSATAIWATAMATRIQRRAWLASSDGTVAGSRRVARRRWRRGSPGVRSGIAGAGARRTVRCSASASCANPRQSAHVGQVGVDRGVVDAGVLAVEPGGDRVADVSAGHTG